MILSNKLETKYKDNKKQIDDYFSIMIEKVDWDNLINKYKYLFSDNPNETYTELLLILLKSCISICDDKKKYDKKKYDLIVFYRYTKGYMFYIYKKKFNNKVGGNYEF